MSYIKGLYYCATTHPEVTFHVREGGRPVEIVRKAQLIVEFERPSGPIKAIYESFGVLLAYEPLRTLVEFTPEIEDEWLCDAERKLLAAGREKSKQKWLRWYNERYGKKEVTA